MSFPIKQILKDCKNPKELEPFLRQAEHAIKTWQSTWSPFVSAPLREEVLTLMSPLIGITWLSNGGYPGAERQRMQCIHSENHCSNSDDDQLPIKGLRIEGNFLFDKASQHDFRKAIEVIGIASDGLGDIWIRNDRGAQAICSLETAKRLDQKIGFVRDVEIHFEAVELNQLQLPAERLMKRYSSVEASKRLDAIASAGFGLSRAKIVNKIKAGQLRLNWEHVKQVSLELKVGDRIQLEERGMVEILSFDITKRNRWKVELLRK